MEGSGWKRKVPSEMGGWEKVQAHLRSILACRLKAQTLEPDFPDENVPFTIHQLSDLG